MKLGYGSNYFTYIISFMLRESWRLLLFNLQIRNLSTGCWRTLPELTQQWLADPRCELTQPNPEPLSSTLCRFLLGYRRAWVRGWGKGPPCYNPRWLINLWWCQWVLLCPLSCSSLLKHIHQQVLVTTLHARASPGYRGSAQLQWSPMTHFHGNCSSPCSVHPKPRGAHENSKWGLKWNKAIIIINSFVPAPTKYLAIPLPLS